LFAPESTARHPEKTIALVFAEPVQLLGCTSYQRLTDRSID